jgi:hypothetical protein
VKLSSPVVDSLPARPVTNNDSGKLIKNDTIVSKKAAVPYDSLASKHRANRAAIYSAVLPGLGQAYNKKYWKMPILYAGFAVLGYSVEFNNNYYKIFKQSYKDRVDGNPATVDDYVNIFPDDQSLLVRKDYYRRTRDFMWILTGALYVLNVVDAYVDAHLADFDVSDDLTLHLTPSFQSASSAEMISGLKLYATFDHHPKNKKW